MARNQNRGMTEAEFEAFREAMDAQSEDLRRALAADLGGDPEDYRAGEQLAFDGGE